MLRGVDPVWSENSMQFLTPAIFGIDRRSPAEVILRLLVLKHIRDWSFEELEREVCANVVYRQFTRIGGGKVPDSKSISRFSRQLGAEVIENIHQRVVAIAQEQRIIQGRKL